MIKGVGMTKSASQLRDDVIDELAFDPTLDATNIGVMAKDGVVTLTSTVAVTRRSSRRSAPQSASPAFVGSPKN